MWFQDLELSAGVFERGSRFCWRLQRNGRIRLDSWNFRRCGAVFRARMEACWESWDQIAKVLKNPIWNLIVFIDRGAQKLEMAHNFVQSNLFLWGSQKIFPNIFFAIDHPVTVCCDLVLFCADVFILIEWFSGRFLDRFPKIRIIPQLALLTQFPSELCSGSQFL